MLHDLLLPVSCFEPDTIDQIVASGRPAGTRALSLSLPFRNLTRHRLRNYVLRSGRPLGI